MAKMIKKSSKNQVTLPKAYVDAHPGVDYFAVSDGPDGGILLKPVDPKPYPQGDPLEEIRAHFKRLGITQKDVDEAVKEARREVRKLR